MNGKRIHDVKALLGEGVEFEGKLMLSGSVRIDGKFKGEVIGGGTLIIGEKASVDADISVDNISIYGEVRGTLNIGEKIEIGSTGRFFGNLKAGIINIQEGAILEGECNMGYKKEQKDISGEEAEK